MSQPLPTDTPLYALPWRRFGADETTSKFSLNQWTRSAAQDNIDSLVKVGDYHFKGLDGSAEPQYEKAAGFYQAGQSSSVFSRTHLAELN